MNELWIMAQTTTIVLLSILVGYCLGKGWFKPTLKKPNKIPKKVQR
jgi:hypothetical protein|tara:strand:+ start:26989 stop:27126 length:138 start_codon:yes stop_codon:yes gene_type:complete